MTTALSGVGLGPVDAGLSADHPLKAIVVPLVVFPSTACPARRHVAIEIHGFSANGSSLMLPSQRRAV